MNDHPIHRNRAGISSVGMIILTLGGILIVFGLCVLLVCSVIGGSGEKVESTERRLLYATNPAKLIDAATQVVQMGQLHPDPTASAMPAIIGRVKPRSITVEDGRVTFECGTNVYRFGLVADTSAASAATTQKAPPMTTKQLAPGVWYYAEDGAMPDP